MASQKRSNFVPFHRQILVFAIYFASQLQQNLAWNAITTRITDWPWEKERSQVNKCASKYKGFK